MCSCGSTQPLLKDGTVELEQVGRGAKVRARDLRFSYTSSREVIFTLPYFQECSELCSICSLLSCNGLLADPESGTVFVRWASWHLYNLQPPNRQHNVSPSHS